MREIKFRFWRDDRMQQAHTMYATEGTNDFQGSGEVMMQFTGLHDKNGKEIYEGDILQLWPEETKDQLKAIVIFEDGAFQYQYITKPQSPDKYRFEHHKMNCHEVIGNIYENPNLLK